MLNFQTSLNDKLTKVPHIFMNPFSSWVDFGYTYQNTQLKVCISQKKKVLVHVTDVQM
jgi:hypothetical protein